MVKPGGDPTLDDRKPLPPVNDLARIPVVDPSRPGCAPGIPTGLEFARTLPPPLVVNVLPLGGSPLLPLLPLLSLAPSMLSQRPFSTVLLGDARM